LRQKYYRGVGKNFFFGKTSLAIVSYGETGKRKKVYLLMYMMEICGKNFKLSMEHHF
jgi:hypothetical protein